MRTNGDGVHNWISPVTSSVDTKRLRKIALACGGCFDHCFFTEPPTLGAEYPKPPLSIVYFPMMSEESREPHAHVSALTRSRCARRILVPVHCFCVKDGQQIFALIVVG
jgi:hypothetical protein